MSSHKSPFLLSAMPLSISVWIKMIREETKNKNEPKENLKKWHRYHRNQDGKTVTIGVTYDVLQTITVSLWVFLIVRWHGKEIVLEKLKSRGEGSCSSKIQFRNLEQRWVECSHAAPSQRSHMVSWIQSHVEFVQIWSNETDVVGFHLKSQQYRCYPTITLSLTELLQIFSVRSCGIPLRSKDLHCICSSILQ